MLFGLAGYLIFQRTAPVSKPSIDQIQASPSATLNIAIPVLDIDLPVYQAKLSGTKWEYSTKGISHLSNTPWPGQPGNSVFYGHNWPNLLGKLNAIKIGDIFKISTVDGHELTYKVHQIDVVSPDHVEILDNTSDDRLTLFTCTGFLDSKRLVVWAFPSSN